MGALTARKSPCDGVEELGGGLEVVHAELHWGHYTVGAHLQTTRERGCNVACIRHGELCCGSGGTRIVRVVDCGYNNVVFKANEYLFEKNRNVGRNRRIVAVGRGKRVFASFRGAVMLGRR